jgi:hypothetical protein
MYIRNWPEGLFILLVMAMPLAVATWRGGAVGGFIVVLGGGAVVGLLLWAGLVWVACRGHTVPAQNKDAEPDAAPDRGGTTAF